MILADKPQKDYWLNILTEMFVSVIPETFTAHSEIEAFALIESHAMSAFHLSRPDLDNDSYLRLVSLLANAETESMHSAATYGVYSDFLAILRNHAHRADWKYYQLYYNLCKEMTGVTLYLGKFDEYLALIESSNKVLAILSANFELAREFWKTDNFPSPDNMLIDCINTFAAGRAKTQEALYWKAVDDKTMIKTSLAGKDGVVNEIDTTNYERLYLSALADFVAARRKLDEVDDGVFLNDGRKKLIDGIDAAKADAMLKLGNYEIGVEDLLKRNLNTAESCLELGSAYLDMGLYDEGINSLNVSLKKCAETYGEDYPLQIAIKIALTLCLKFKAQKTDDINEKNALLDSALAQVADCDALMDKGVEFCDAEAVSSVKESIVAFNAHLGEGKGV